MRDPKIVLEWLSSLKEDQRVTNIYKNLYNPEFYKIAYQNIYSKPSQMTKASDGSTIDGMSEERINKLIQSLRDGTYQPTILRRVNIPKKNGKTRPISIPSFNDKLVQEIIRMILEALWEPHFLDCSHGFRPNRSCHTALKYTQQKFKGTKWWIDADIKGCFDNINHIILINTLKERIREQKFIHLINLFLKAGYIGNWKYHKTYSGTPQGSIISPILSNIYLHNFDKYIQEFIKVFNKGTHRRYDPNYNKIYNRANACKKRIQAGTNLIQNRIKYKMYKKEEKDYVRKYGTTDQYDPNFRRMNYVRYADDFVLGIIGTKSETEEILDKIKKFLKSNLLLEVNIEKTKVLHNSELVRFLGYGISISRSKDKPVLRGNVHLWLPHDVCKKFIIDNKYGKYVQDSKTGKPKLKALCRPELINIEEIEIIMQYNSKIRGIYNYYKLASNVCKLYEFNYICQLSFLKTLSAKYKTKCAKLYQNKNYNHRKNNASHIGITYKNKFYEFFNGSFKVVKIVKYEPKIDIIENVNKYFVQTSIIKRMEARVCEWCGNTEGPFEVHHVHKLKDLKGKANWEKLMISRRRKTLVLCLKCHDKLHAGKL